MATKKTAKKTSTSKSKSSSKKNPPKSLVKGKSTRKYSPSAGKNVEREMKEMKQGKLKSGHREESDQSEAGNCHRAFRGAEGRQKSSAQKILEIQVLYPLAFGILAGYGCTSRGGSEEVDQFRNIEGFVGEGEGAVVDNLAGGAVEGRDGGAAEA